MDPDILDTCKDRCAAAYLAKSGFASAPVGFDPTIIVTIVIAVLQACMKPAADVKASASERGWMSEMVVKSHVRQELRRRHGLFAYGKFNGDAIADAVFQVADNSSEEEVGKMMDAVS